MKINEILSFPIIKNNSVTIELNFLLDLYLLSYHQTILTLSYSLLDFSLPNFDKHHQLLVNNQ